MMNIASILLLLALCTHSFEIIDGYKDFKFGQTIDEVKQELSQSEVSYVTGTISATASEITSLFDEIESIKKKSSQLELSKYQIRKGDTGTVDFTRFSLCNSDPSKLEMMAIGYPIIDNDSIDVVVDTANAVRFVFVKKKLRLVTKLNIDNHSMKKVAKILEEKYGTSRLEESKCIYRETNGSRMFVYNVVIKQKTGQVRLILMSDFQDSKTGAVNSYEPETTSNATDVFLLSGAKVIGVSYSDSSLVEEMAEKWNSIVNDYLEIKMEIKMRKEQMESDSY